MKDSIICFICISLSIRFVHIKWIYLGNLSVVSVVIVFWSAFVLYMKLSPD